MNRALGRGVQKRSGRTLQTSGDRLVLEHIYIYIHTLSVSRAEVHSVQRAPSAPGRVGTMRQDFDGFVRNPIIP